MKCQYCDSEVQRTQDRRVCPNCGAPLIDGDKKTVCLEDYYYRYRPNRIKAAVALQRDTGMSPVKASRLINQIFDNYADPLVKSLQFRNKQQNN